MRAALTGWFLVVLAIIGGWALGVHRRNARAERRLEQQREPAPIERPALPSLEVSTAAADELPTDAARPDSIPKALE